MIQFIIISAIIVVVIAHFYDVDTALASSKQLLNWWILAGIAVAILGPIFCLFRTTYIFLRKIAGALLSRKDDRAQNG